MPRSQRQRLPEALHFPPRSAHSSVLPPRRSARGCWSHRGRPARHPQAILCSMRTAGAVGSMNVIKQHAISMAAEPTSSAVMPPTLIERRRRAECRAAVRPRWRRSKSPHLQPPSPIRHRRGSDRSAATSSPRTARPNSASPPTMIQSGCAKVGSAEEARTSGMTARIPAHKRAAGTSRLKPSWLRAHKFEER